MKPLPPLTAHDAKVREQFREQFSHLVDAADAQAKRKGIKTLLPSQAVLMIWITEKLHERDKLHEKLGEPSGWGPEDCRYCYGKGYYTRWSAGGTFDDFGDDAVTIAPKIEKIVCPRCKGKSRLPNKTA